jgi:hypothetical protein
MVVYAACIALLLGNLLLIVVSWFFGPRLIWVCRAAVLVNGIALILLLVPLFNLLFATNPPPEYRTAIKTLLTFTAPILVETLGLLAIHRWRM